MTLVPRLLQVWISATIIAVAVVVGALQAALAGTVVGPFTAIVLGVLVCPSLLRGARTGSMRARTAWSVAAVAIAVPVLATMQLDPGEATYLSVSWYSCGILAGAMLAWSAHRPGVAVVGVAFLVGHTAWWAGPVGVLRLGTAAEVLLLIAMLLVYRSIRIVAEAAVDAEVAERRLIVWQAEQEAVHQERRRRLHAAGRDALPLLRRIVGCGCDLDDAARDECRLLEQTIRDEIRGRRLLNDAVRSAVLEHRRRGALVQLLDDGGLDALAPSEVEPLLHELAGRIRSVQSTRIVVRTGAADSAAAITIVATTPEGEDLDDAQVDLWEAIPRPRVSGPAGHPTSGHQDERTLQRT